MSIFIRTIVIYLILSLMLRLMGKRQIGELEVNELVSTLLISEIAAIPISDTDISLIPAVIPILFISALEVVISLAKNKSNLLKKTVEGDPVYIIYKGNLRQNALLNNRISINEVLTEMRVQGIADISEISYAILEPNGKLSLLKRNDGTPFSRAVVIDTEIDDKNLKEIGISSTWVHERLKERRLSLNDIFLMTVSDDGAINIIEKEKKQ